MIIDPKISSGVKEPPPTIFENWRWKFSIYWTIGTYALIGLFSLYLMYDSFVSPPGDYRDYSDDEDYYETTELEEEEEQQQHSSGFDHLEEWQVKLE